MSHLAASPLLVPPGHGVPGGAPGAVTMEIASHMRTGDVVHMRRLHRIATAEPFARSWAIGRRVAVVSLIPAGLIVEAFVEGPRHVIAMASNDECTLVVDASSEDCLVHASAASAEVLDALESEVSALAAAHADPSASTHEMSVWHGYSGGGHCDSRPVDLPSWPAIRANYPVHVADRLEQVMGLAPPFDAGRLLLWRGEPGTGKTTAVLALLDAWSSWCDGHLVTDPERLFADSGYLADVLGAAPEPTVQTRIGDVPTPGRWKLLIAEDVDALLAADSPGRTSAELSRALNATDGILARGTRTVILVTANSELSALHPALVRPGRCLVDLQFDRFTETEAQAWLGGATCVPGPMTLAELFEHRRSGSLPTGPAPTGQYL